MPNRQIILPGKLSPGDTIGIVAPSGVVRDTEAFEKGIKILQQLGFSVKFPRKLWPGNYFLADSDQNRIDEFHHIWFDEEVDAVMSARGGYGCLRIAGSIDFEALNSTPKLFIGFSDITLLHNCIQNRSGLATLHGPVVTSLHKLTKESLNQFRRRLVESVETWCYEGQVEKLRGDRDVYGITAGGNLSTIISTIGTPHQPDWDNKVVFLEDTSEHSYKVDKMLTQLHLCGLLNNAAALILGDFSNGLGLDRNSAMGHHEYIWNRTLELVPETTTVWADFPMGHGEKNVAVPMGINVVLTSEKPYIRAV